MACSAPGLCGLLVEPDVGLSKAAEEPQILVLCVGMAG